MNFYQLNLARLAQETDSTKRLDAIFDGINYALAAPYNAMEIMGGAKNLAAMSRGLHGAPVAVKPDHALIKAFLAQKYTVAADTPYLSGQTARFEQWFHTNMPMMDMGWMVLFDEVPLAGTPHSGFDIYNTNAGITFTEIKVGGEVKVKRNITESKTSCEMVEYGAGFGILDIWLEDQKWWEVQRVVDEIQSQYWNNMATIHYGLFTAQGAGIDISFDTDDTVTFNNACADILRDLETSGLGISENPGFYILCNPEKKGRIQKMLMSQQGSQIVEFNAAKQPLTYSVTGVISSTKVPANSTGYYLILAGYKNKRAVKRPLSIESARDIYKRASDLVATTRFNAIVGDTNQVRRVKYA